MKLLIERNDIMDRKSNIGKRISHYRKVNCLTQAELADKLKISTQAVSKWEQEITFPDIALLPEIAETFKISIDELFGKQIETEPVFDWIANVPWKDDKKIRIAIYQGQKLMQQSEHEIQQGDNLIQFQFDYGQLYKLNGFCKLYKE